MIGQDVEAWVIYYWFAGLACVVVALCEHTGAWCVFNLTLGTITGREAVCGDSRVRYLRPP